MPLPQDQVISTYVNEANTLANRLRAMHKQQPQEAAIEVAIDTVWELHVLRGHVQALYLLIAERLKP